MNQNIHWGKIIILLTIVVGIAVLFFYIGKRFASAPPQLIEHHPSEKLAVQSAYPLEYVDKEYGFKLRLPNELAQYKVTKDEGVIKFWMPTVDQEWIEVFKKAGDVHEGYVPLFSLRSMTHDDSEALQEECRIEQGITCGITYVFKTNAYAFHFVNPQDGPEDIGKLLNIVTREYVKENVALIPDSPPAQ